MAAIHSGVTQNAFASGCRATANWFGLIEEKIVEKWPSDPPTNREVVLQRSVELDPATLA